MTAAESRLRLWLLLCINALLVVYSFVIAPTAFVGVGLCWVLLLWYVFCGLSITEERKAGYFTLCCYCLCSVPLPRGAMG